VGVIHNGIMKTSGKNERGVGVFFTPNNKGAIPSLEQLESDLSEEMKRYE